MSPNDENPRPDAPGQVMPARSILWLRVISITEALSYLFLLGIAMPLKYIWKLPEAVRWGGSIHGGLFVMLVLSLLVACYYNGNKMVPLAVKVFIASLIPFAPFFLDPTLRDCQDSA